MSRTICAALVALLILMLAPASAETTLRFDQRAHQLRGPGTDDLEWHALVTHRAQLERKWAQYQLRGEAPRIGFDRKVGVFAGTGGSSSCPLYVHDVQLRRAIDRIVVRVANDVGDANGCTGDWRTSTFLLSISKRQLPRLDDLQVRVGRAR